MYVWDHRNRRHRGLARKLPRPPANATASLTREDQKHEAGLEEEETWRQELENTEVNIKLEDVRRLIMEYMDDPAGKQELHEVVENLRHWKENCTALGYDSDGEQLSEEANEGSAEGAVDADGASGSERREKERRKTERGETSRRRKAREVFDMFDADGSRTISITEMKALLEEMCIPLNRHQLKKLMMDIDTDGSGEVDFDEFYQWYQDNASAARSADKTQTVGLFATKLMKGLTGFTLRMEALRIIVAHAQSQVEKRERERFRQYRPPRLVCDHCTEAFASVKEEKRHMAKSDSLHEAWEAGELEARRRFHPVAVLLDHTTPPAVEGAPPEPFKSDGPTARKKRLRRLVFSGKFYVLYGGVGWGGTGTGTGTGVEAVEEKRWVNKPHPRLGDPDDRRGAQLRRQQSVEGINPSDARAKVSLEVTRGGLMPNWGGVRRGRATRRAAGRETTGIQHILLRLLQEKARAANVFTADDILARAQVTFRWDGWSSDQVTLHAEFNRFAGEGMGEDQVQGRIGHSTTHSLSPGTYKYFFTVDGRRRVDTSLPVIGNGSDDLFNVVTVTNEHLGEAGERAVVPLSQDSIESSGSASSSSSTHLTHPPRTTIDSPENEKHQPCSSHTNFPDAMDPPVQHRQPEGRPPPISPSPSSSTKVVARQSQDHPSATSPPSANFSTKDYDDAIVLPSAKSPSSPAKCSAQEEDGIVMVAAAAAAAAAGTPDEGGNGLAEARTDVAAAAAAAATTAVVAATGAMGAGRAGEANHFTADAPGTTSPLTRIDLSRHQISDDGAVALALALRQNVRIEELDLSFNRISGEGIAALAASLEHPRCCVARLSLSQNGIGRRGGEHLGRMLAGGEGAGQWGQVACLRELNLADNTLGDDGVEHLCEGLLGHPCLETLILDGNDIGHDGTECLSDALLHNASLLKLSLRRNCLLADAAQKLAKMLVRNGSIKALDLAYNKVGPEGLRRLSVFLTSNHRLESLGLRGCGVQPHGVKSGIYALARGLHVNRAIASLDLGANDLDEYAGQELAHALLKNKTLAMIDLTGNNHIPDEWLRENHQVCSEVYGFLPSLAEGLRLNRVRSKSGAFVSPRSAHLKKTREKKAQADERHKRQERARRRAQCRRQRRYRERAAKEQREATTTTTSTTTGADGEEEETPPAPLIAGERPEEKMEQQEEEEEEEKEEEEGGVGVQDIRRGDGSGNGVRDEISAGAALSSNTSRRTMAGVGAFIKSISLISSAVRNKPAPPATKHGDSSSRSDSIAEENKQALSSITAAGVAAGDVVPVPKQENSSETSCKKRRHYQPPCEGGNPGTTENDKRLGGRAVAAVAAAVADPKRQDELQRSSSSVRNGGKEGGERFSTKRPKKKKGSNNNNIMPTLNVAAATRSRPEMEPEPSKKKRRPTIVSAGDGDGAGSSCSTTAAAVAAAAATLTTDETEEEEEGLQRVPGVWTRRGRWAPANEISDEVANQAGAEGRRVGDKQRQRREDEEVMRAGNAKREELLEYLKTPDGEALVARVATLLVHARREQERETRAVERTQRAELRAYERQKQRQTREQQRLTGTEIHDDGEGTATTTRPRPFWLTASSALSKSLLRGQPTNPLDKNSGSTSLGGQQTNRLDVGKSGSKSLLGQPITHLDIDKKTGAGGADARETAATAAAKEEWDSMFGGESDGTVGTLMTGSTVASSLPSAAAAAAMEAEDEGDAKRLIGRLREEQKVWDLKHRPAFLRAFERFDPEGWGHIPASDIGDLMAQLRLPEAIDEGTVKAVTDALVKAADSERREQKKAAARAARRSGLDQALSAPRPFTVGSGEKTVGMLHFWRWHRGEHFQKKASKNSRSRRELHRLASQQRRREKTGEISKDWARRVVLAVGEREARLEAADKFRGTDPPRYVCPECNEYGCSSADGLDEHLRDTSWHDVQAALQETFEDNADLVAMAKRVGDEEPFPEYVQVARDLPEETELPVHEEPTEISRPLGTIKFDMLVLALEEEGEWLKINFESHRGVYVKHTSTVAAGRQRPRRVITRMHLPAARATAKAVASTAHLLSATATAHSTLTRPLTLAASGLNTLGHSTLSTLNTFASFALHGHRGAHEPEALAPGTAIFKPRVVRFVLPRVFCHAKGVPPDAMLKIRSDPGGAEGTAGATATATGESASGGGRVLGRLGSGQCVVALATSGDWLQVRYKTYEAAWMLMTYRGRSLMAPLSEVYPGLVVMVATEGGGGQAWC